MIYSPMKLKKKLPHWGRKRPQNYPKTTPSKLSYSSTLTTLIMQFFKKNYPNDPKNSFQKILKNIDWGRIERACLISATIESLKKIVYKELCFTEKNQNIVTSS